MTTGRNSEALMRVLLVEDDAQTAASIKMLLINEKFYL
jgi:DNA-binding response OmpR family regulator